jgi:hypothetical protein
MTDLRKKVLRLDIETVITAPFIAGERTPALRKKVLRLKTGTIALVVKS